MSLLRNAYLRHALYYVQLADRASQLYQQGGKYARDGLALFDLERPQIDNGWAWARSHADEIGADILAQEYADQTTHIGALRYDTRRERIPQLEAALAIARRRCDRDAEGTYLNHLGIAYMDIGEIRRSIELYEQGLAIRREMSDQDGEAIVLGNLGIAYAAIGEVRHAIELFEQILNIIREIGDQQTEKMFCSTLV